MFLVGKFIFLIIAYCSNSSTSPGEVESNFSVGATPSITESQPAPSLQDRAQSSAAAVAMALSAASQQKLACFQMLDAARKEKDKTLKAMMMALAMQMCAQADQTMQNAYENKKGYKLVSGSDIPKQAEMKIEGMNLSKDKIKEADVLRLEYSEQKLPEVSDNEIANLVKPTISSNNDNGDNPKLPSDNTAKYKPQDFEELHPQKAVNIEFGNSPKGSSSGTSLGPGFSVAGGVSEKGTTAKSGEAVRERLNNQGSKRTISSLTEAAISSASSPSNENSKDYSKILNELLGGGEVNKLDGVNGGELISLTHESEKESSRNIFEYATFRYYTLAYEKGRIRHSRTAQNISPQNDVPVSK